MQIGSKKRIELYETLSMLLGVGSFNNAISQMIRTYEKNARQIFGKEILESKRIIIEMLEDVAFRHQKLGMNSVDALSIYLPKNELMMLSGHAHVSVETLNNTKSVTTKLSDMRSKLLKQLLSPLVYLVASFGMLMVVDMGLRPVVLSTGNMDKMPQSTQFLMGFSHWFVGNYQWVIVGCLFIFVMILVVMMRVVNGFRLYVLDYIIPFSIYKRILSVRFLISLSLLLKKNETSENSSNHAARTGLPIPEAIQNIEKYANRYTRHFIQKMRESFSRGVSSGVALVQSGFFPKSLVSLIEMYGYSNQLEKGIHALGHEYLETQIRQIDAAFKVMNYLFMAILGGFILWYVDVMLSLNQAFAVHP
ncbi:type II secretion system F family protein [Fangia hongkongensis]|nr:type II secretion system F family protein [Fangia hongkongensis]